MKEVYRSLMRRRSMWYKRLLAEYKYCTGSTFFITLTYEDSHVPMEFGSDGLPLFYTTSKRDVQLWFKRIRKRCVSDLGRIRYFIVSEFGENTGRPHYHAIVFTDVRCSLDYMTEAINETWQKGYINDVQYLKGNGGLRYVANYITKALDCYKTFALMSRRPGLGISYVEAQSDYHRGTAVPIDVSDDGTRRLLAACMYHPLKKRIDFFVKRKFFVLCMSNVKPLARRKPSLPRYLRDKLYTKFERELLFRRYLDDECRELSELSAEDRRNREIQFEERERMAKDSYLRSLSKHGGTALYAMHCREEIQQRGDQAGCENLGFGLGQFESSEWLP